MPSSKYGLLPMGIQPSPLYSIKTNLTPTVHLGDSILRFSTTIGMQCVPRAEQCAGIHEPVVVILRFSVTRFIMVQGAGRHYRIGLLSCHRPYRPQGFRTPESGQQCWLHTMCEKFCSYTFKLTVYSLLTTCEIIIRLLSTRQSPTPFLNPKVVTPRNGAKQID